MTSNVHKLEWLSQLVGRDVRTLGKTELLLLMNRMEKFLKQRANEECLKIATQFYARFPREIRDLMYSLLVHSEERTTIGGRPEEDSYGSDFNEQVQPTYHAMDPAYVEEQMAQEVTEAYYFGGNFFVLDSKYLEKLLKTDTFGTGVKPHDHVCDIWVLIHYDYIPDTALNEKRFLDDIRNQTQLLSLIKRKDKLNLQIRLLTNFWNTTEYVDPMDDDYSEDNGEIGHGRYRVNDARRMMNLLEAIRQPVYDLLHAGSTVHVLHYNQDGNLDDQEFTGERSLTRFGEYGANKDPENNFFQLTAEEWQQERAGYGPGGASPQYLSRTDDNYENRNYTLNAQDKEELSRRLETRWGKNRALAGFRYHQDYWDDQVEYWVHDDDDDELLHDGWSGNESDEDGESGDEEMTEASDEELTETEDA